MLHDSFNICKIGVYIKYNMIGGSMMGIGGIMAIGCTVGQGLSGVSTLVFSSFLAIISIGVSG